MAPSGGYHMVPKAVRAVKYAISRSSDSVRARLSGGGHVQAAPIAIRTTPNKHALHPLALLRQSRARSTRLFSTALARLSQAGIEGSHVLQHASRVARAQPSSATRSALRHHSTFAPFASPLRPNLTGGALPRSAGGYGLGGGGIKAARHFSHTSSAQAQVVHNVHAAVRAFFLNGHRPLYDGVDSKGSPRFRAVGPVEEKAHATVMKHSHHPSKSSAAWNVRGTNLEFNICPAITAVHGNGSVLDDEVIKGLATDFARQLRDLAAVRADLKRLEKLGALPVDQDAAGAVIRVRFAGCDAQTVSALCDEVGVTRGMVREDAGWELEEESVSGKDDDNVHHHQADRDVEMALLFPWAPTEVEFDPRSHYRGSDYGSNSASNDNPVTAREDSSVAESAGAVFRYFAPASARPLPRPYGPTEPVEWHSMLSPPTAVPTARDAHAHAAAPHATAPAIPSSSLHSFALLSPPSSPSAGPGLGLVSEGVSCSDFEPLAHSEAASEEEGDYGRSMGPGLGLVRTATVTATNAPRDDYEGVEGIYRFLREMENAEGRVGLR